MCAASGDACSVLCVLQGKKLVTVQGQGRNSILCCSVEGEAPQFSLLPSSFWFDVSFEVTMYLSCVNTITVR